jgi:hypothetical protein
MTTEQYLREALDTACVNMYLEYVNDYLTLEYMANNKNMSVNALKAMVDRGREIFNNKK